MNSRTPAPDTLVLLLSEANLSASFGPYRVNLTELELQVLKTLQAEHGRFLNRSEILGRLGYDRETDPAMIDTVIYRIRQKFRRAGLMEDFIKTLRGQGYSIKAAEQK